MIINFIFMIKKTLWVLGTTLLLNNVTPYKYLDSYEDKHLNTCFFKVQRKINQSINSLFTWSKLYASDLYDMNEWVWEFEKKNTTSYDVFLESDNYFIDTSKEELKEARIYKDLVVKKIKQNKEIKNILLKSNEYKNISVKEIWIHDLDAELYLIIEKYPLKTKHIVLSWDKGDIIIYMDEIR